MNDHTRQPSAPDLATVARRLDALSEDVAYLAARARRTEELFDELGPISKEALAALAGNLATIEEKGYFDFATEVGRVIDTVVTSYSADDVRQLGENVVRILDTVKRVTQPDVLAITQDATMALSRADAVEPKGVLGMLRETRDDDVRRGVAIALEVLRYVGRGTARLADGPGAVASADAPARLAAMLGPRRDGVVPPRPAPQERAAAADRLAAQLGPRRPRTAPPPAPGAEPAPTPSEKTGASAIVGDACRWVPDEEWSRAWAAAVASRIGVAEMTDEHWKVIEFARAEYVESGAPPNVRRITQGSGVDTRTVYQLFAKAPGIATAMCAGIPKPGGCL